MTSSHDSDPFDTLSLAESDASSDFELVDIETDERPFIPSSNVSDAASSTSDAPDTCPLSPQLGASRFHFPDPVSVFQDESAELNSSSIYTLMASHHQLEHPSTPPIDVPTISALAKSELNPSSVAFEHDLGAIEMSQPSIPAKNQQDYPAPSQLNTRIVANAPKAACIIALLATLLLGFKSPSLLGLTEQSTSSITMYANSAKWSTKFASPATTATPKIFDSQAFSLSSFVSSSLALVASASSSSSAVLDAKRAQRTVASTEHIEKPAQLVFDPSKKHKAVTVRSASSVALQNPASASESGKIFKPPCTAERAKADCVKKCEACLQRRCAKRYAESAFQMPSKFHPDSPVLPDSSQSCATTMTWEFWLAELQKDYDLYLMPAMVAARDQAFETARIARRYHQEQVLPAFTSLREQALQAAQRTAEFTAQYNQEQLRPALAFVREQAAQTAQRTAEYHDKVVVPALAQFRQEQLRPALAFVREQAAQTAQRTAEYHDKVVVPALAQFCQQASQAGRTTSDGLSKAAKRFSSEAIGTVQHVREATNINLEALGVDEYVGFMITTAKSIKQNLHHPEQTT
ncbi:uncharacterized protein MEPE_05466 [Melanopsichium pennsylvanicum]|uniref:Uncharacterized protein n=2 Tax=Melanopsichium pennsylvanicum TaxID=63383 RepID=A0AAJ4XRY3_9BASI|nr:putative protein (C-terminal fragment) [Melanopsichium pennsylvanicum 4]SNX86757.1 uncharacterized protein MEPE_05466 [Melanopsichium pennsylvanicum]